MKLSPFQSGVAADVGAGVGVGVGVGDGVGEGAGAAASRTSWDGYVVVIAWNWTELPLSLVNSKHAVELAGTADIGTVMLFHPADTVDVEAIAVPSGGRVFHVTVLIVHAQDDRRTVKPLDEAPVA